MLVGMLKVWFVTLLKQVLELLKQKEQKKLKIKQWLLLIKK